MFDWKGYTVPIDYLSIQKQIKEKGQEAGLQWQDHLERAENARRLLAELAGDLEFLQSRVAQALEKNSGLRCAVPYRERLDISGQPSPSKEALSILAADGSQIIPDRHGRVEFGVINIGVFSMVTGVLNPQPPQEITRSRLLYGKEMEQPGGMINEGLLSLWRDLDERRTLAELAARQTLPVVALTDGPLELYREPRQQEEFSGFFQDYLDELGRLASLDAVTAGYVDKTRADLVVRLLELALFKDAELRNAGKSRPMQGVSDVEILGPLLVPGERSAIFALQSPATQYYKDELALYFFYLKTGRPGRSALARVEIPAWVAWDEHKVDRLHAALVSQCDPIGSLPYPYALHRAHEIALVRHEEKQWLENALVAEQYRQGIEVGAPSNKQALKDCTGSRKRYKR